MTLESRVDRQAAVARLCAEGLDTYETAAKLGCSQSTVSNDRRALGIVSPKGRRARHPAPPTDRTCATCGKPLEFRFPSDVYHRREGGQLVERRFCSTACKYEAMSKYPKPEPRLCVCGCGREIQPTRSRAATGEDLYYANECRRTGELVACACCGEEVYLPAWAIRRGYRFCSLRCWAAERWQRGTGLRRLIERYGGAARRKWKLKWVDRPGRPRNDARLDYEDALQKIRDKYEETHAAERELAALTGESQRMVRTALGRPV